MMTEGQKRKRVKAVLPERILPKETDCYVSDVVVTEERGCDRIKEGSGKCAICRRNKNNAGIPCY